MNRADEPRAQVGRQEVGGIATGKPFAIDRRINKSAGKFHPLAKMRVERGRDRRFVAPEPRSGQGIVSSKLPQTAEERAGSQPALFTFNAWPTRNVEGPSNARESKAFRGHTGRVF